MCSIMNDMIQMVSEGKWGILVMRPRVIWFFRTITLESLNQSEPNFHT